MFSMLQHFQEWEKKHIFVAIADKNRNTEGFKGRTFINVEGSKQWNPRVNWHARFTVSPTSWGLRKKKIWQIVTRLFSFSKFSQHFDAFSAFKCKERALADRNDKMQIQCAAQLKAPCGHIGESMAHAALLIPTQGRAYCDSKKAPYMLCNQLKAKVALIFQVGLCEYVKNEKLRSNSMWRRF